jgi:hypothetical protein
MANSDKNIVIIPSIGNTAEPRIVFTGANVNPTTLRTLDDGTLSFEGGTGQLFSISNTITGNVIFGVNDVTGFPIIEAYANAQVQFNRLGGRFVVGAANTAPAAQMTIQGNSGVVGLSFVGQGTSNTGFMVTPAGVRFVSIGGGELALLSLAQLRFSDSAAYSYDSWGGIRWNSANNTMIVGGPGAPGISNNNVISSNVIMHNATTGNFMVANSTATNLFVGANGNIGIGNTTPNYTLVVAGSMRLNQGFSHGGSGDIFIDAPSVTGGRLTITSDATVGGPNANVGIGVAAPATKLQVNGSVSFTNSTVTQSLFAANGNVGIGNTTPGSKLVVQGDAAVTGFLVLNETTEILNTKTGATGTVVHDLTTGSIFYHTSIAANFTCNLTNVPTTDSRTITITLVLVQGATPYIPNAFQIDGAAQTIKWSGGAAPTGNASKTDVVTFSLIRTGAAWAAVLGQLGMFN